MNTGRMECNIKVNSSKALRAGATFSCLCLREEDCDSSWRWWRRMWPRVEQNTKRRTNPVVTAALTVCTKQDKTRQGFTRETPISYLNEAKETPCHSQGCRGVLSFPAGLLTSEGPDGVVSPLDCKGSWRPGHPHLWNTWEVNNRLSFLKSIYCHFQGKKKAFVSDTCIYHTFSVKGAL